MAAPTVTRPTTTVTVENTAAKGVEWAQYARWVLIAAVVLGVAGLAASMVVKYNDDAREAKARGQWDEVYKGLKEKSRSDERIAALEALAENEKIKGTAAHGYILMQLAATHFEAAQNAKKAPEEREAARQRAEALYDFVAKTDPFKSSPSFGPLAARNLALTFEQKQMDGPGTEGFDKAIETLSETLYGSKTPAADAPALAGIQQHFLFDQMRAQLGRVYWLRAQREKDAKQKEDLDRARTYINKALETPPSAEETKSLNAAASYYRLGTGTAAWRNDAAYLKSLLDTPGKLLPDGKAPPMKEIKKTDAEKKAEADKNAQPPANSNKPTATPPTAPTPAKVEPAKPAPTESKKEEPKKEEKKTGSAPVQNAPTLSSDEASAPSEHLSYAQIQQLLKSGKPALCLCPRCANGSKSVGAKLAE